MNMLDRLSLPGKFSLLAVLCLALIAAPMSLFILGAMGQSCQAVQESSGMQPVSEQRATLTSLTTQATNSFGKLTDTQLISANELNYPVADYLATYTRTIDALFAFNRPALDALAQALEARRTRPMLPVGSLRHSRTSSTPWSSIS